MSEVYSYLWDFTSVPRFFDDWNIKFNLSEMNGSSNNFQFVFCDYSENNINDCLNGDVLNTSNVNSITTVDCSLKWDSNSKVITVGNNVTWNIGNSTYPIKAVFLRKKTGGYVMGYCIHENSFDVTNQLKIPKDTILWSIQ